MIFGQELSHGACFIKHPKPVSFLLKIVGRSTMPRLLIYLWTLPTTAFGLLFLLPTLLTCGQARIHTGVLEISGGLTCAFLRYCTLLKGGASAMTLGHVVLARSPALHDRTRSHERVHVRQCERWGPLFLPAYLLASAWLALMRKDPYRDNPFEREAFANE